MDAHYVEFLSMLVRWLHIIAGLNTFHGTYSIFRSWAATIAQRARYTCASPAG